MNIMCERQYVVKSNDSIISAASGEFGELRSVTVVLVSNIRLSHDGRLSPCLVTILKRNALRQDGGPFEGMRDPAPTAQANWPPAT